MLSSMWSEKQHHDDVELRMNLFKGLSHILLSISKMLLPCICPFIIDKASYLSNCLLSMELQELEKEIPSGLSCDYTYSTFESYVTDILRGPRQPPAKSA